MSKGKGEERGGESIAFSLSFSGMRIQKEERGFGSSILFIISQEEEKTTPILTPISRRGEEGDLWLIHKKEGKRGNRRTLSLSYPGALGGRKGTAKRYGEKASGSSATSSVD